MKVKEVKEVKEEKKSKKKKKKKRNKYTKLIFILICIIVILIAVFVIPSREGITRISVKSSLDRIEKSSDLETVSFTYNVIAKKCEDKDDCNLQSNDIDEFEYVVSCKGTVTAGIDFEKVKIDIDKDAKKLILTLPESSIKDTNVESLDFINGDDIPAEELPNARKLCEDTTKEKSDNDEDLLPAAREQAIDVLKSFYKQWLKAYDEEYKIVVK